MRISRWLAPLLVLCSASAAMAAREIVSQDIYRGTVTLQEGVYTPIDTAVIKQGSGNYLVEFNFSREVPLYLQMDQWLKLTTCCTINNGYRQFYIGPQTQDIYVGRKQSFDAVQFGGVPFYWAFDFDTRGDLQPDWKIGHYSELWASFGTAVQEAGDLHYSIIVTKFAASPTPEPATWAMFLLGFGAVGVTVRRRLVFA